MTSHSSDENREPGATLKDGASDGGLVLQDVSLRFGGVAALTEVSFAVNQGQTVGLIGPNGAGKSTLINCIVGLYKPNAGHIWLDGRRIDGTAAHRLAAAGISRTFQNLRLLPTMSVLENVMLGCHAGTGSGMLASILRTRRQRTEEAMIRDRSVSLLDQFGLTRVAARPVASLPYAEQKATEICRALAAEPKLLLLDEPAAGMSADERERAVEVIGALSVQNLSILLIEHDVGLVMRTCERVIVLDHGVKIADDVPLAVRADPAVISAYFGDEG